jgi:hypothetical protein
MHCGPGPAPLRIERNTKVKNKSALPSYPFCCFRHFAQRSVLHVTRMYIASRRGMTTRSSCIACGNRFAVFAVNQRMCVAGDRNH